METHLSSTILYTEFTSQSHSTKMQNRAAKLKSPVTEEPHLKLMGDGEAFKEELCQMIERAQLFDDFSRAEIVTITRYVRAYQIDRNETLFAEGGKGSFMAVLMEGKVDIFKMDDQRHSKRITTIRPGKSMGEMSLLDGLPHSATATVIEKATVLVFTRLNFDRLLEEQPVIGVNIMRKIARLLSLRLRQTTGILLDYLD